MAYKYKLLLGGIGDDAHSVGIRLLELGFLESDFEVKNIGIRNKTDVFFECAKDYDIILVSNKNGHAELYLQDFASKLSYFKLIDNSPKLWYLGGSLSVSESDFQIKKKFLGMGFTNVYPKPISFAEVLSDIRKDIHRNNIHKKLIRSNSYSSCGSEIDTGEIIDRRWTKEELDHQRKDVLSEWHTGNDVSINFFSKPQSVTLDQLLWKNKTEGKQPLFQPRTGVADIEQQISKLRFLEEEGSDVSSTQLDAASRSRLYASAQKGYELSLERKSSQLNGFPIPIYGVKEVSRLISSLKKPFQLRGGGPNHKFTYEIALSAGISALEGGFICYCLPYDKTTPVTESLKNWQYIDRLCAVYQANYGISINREYFGVLTATLIEPSLAIVVNIVQALASAQQGIDSISVGYAEQGNRVQDIAAIQVMEELVEKYLNEFNYKNIKVTTVFHQFMAAFPSETAKAEELIFNSSISATIAKATKVMVKTAMEAIKIPDRYDNARAVKLSKQGAAAAKHIRVDQQKLGIEKALIRKEVTQIMDVVLELGNNSPLIGAIKAIEHGIIDVPWSPSIFNKNKTITVRDINGAVRFYDFGNLPFDDDLKDFHREKVSARKNLERDSSIFSLLEKDLCRIWKNDYKCWPLDNVYVN